MPVVRLRSGQHRDTSQQLLEQRQRATGYKVTASAPSSRTATGTGASAPAQPKATPTSPVTGARILRNAGGSAHDVAIWRSLSAERRKRIRQNVSANGGSLLTRVRRIQRRRQARR